MKAEIHSEPPSGYDDLLGNFKALAESLRGIQELGVRQYTPVVERIIRTRSGDIQHIEHTLDYLLDFACHPDGLVLFKSLCRYYYSIDPAATADYVDTYRKLWDTEDKEEES